MATGVPSSASAMETAAETRIVLNVLPPRSLFCLRDQLERHALQPRGPGRLDEHDVAGLEPVVKYRHRVRGVGYSERLTAPVGLPPRADKYRLGVRAHGDESGEAGLGGQLPGLLMVGAGLLAEF